MLLHRRSTLLNSATTLITEVPIFCDIKVDSHSARIRKQEFRSKIRHEADSYFMPII